MGSHGTDSRMAEPHDVDWRSRHFRSTFGRWVSLGKLPKDEEDFSAMKKSALSSHTSMTDGSYTGVGGVFAKQLAATGECAIWNGAAWGCSVARLAQNFRLRTPRKGSHERQAAITLDTVVKPRRTS